MAKTDESDIRIISAAEKARVESEITRLEKKRVQLTSKLGETGGDYRENAAFQDLDAEIQHTIRTINMHRGTLAKSVVGVSENEQHPYLGQRLIVTMPPSREEIVYEIVPADQVDPGAGKVSVTAPISSAIRNKTPGQEFEVVLGSKKEKNAPKVRYKFERVEKS